MAVSYFGRCNSDGTILSGLDLINRGLYNGYLTPNDGTNCVFTCPGSGSLEVKSLAFYGVNLGASSHNVKAMIFNTAGTSRLLITSGFAVANGGSAGWKEITGLSGTNLTGGTAYRLAFISDSDDMAFVCSWEDNVGYGYDGSGSYATPPSDLTDFEISTNEMWPVFRCGVEAAAAATTYLHGIMSHHFIPRLVGGF